MIELMKHVAIWLLCTIGAFAAIYLFGSFCVLSLDITAWTSPAGRFTIAFVAGIIGMMGVCAIDDANKMKAMSEEEREKYKARREQEDRHADY